MVEPPVMVESGGGKMTLSPSSAAISPLPLQERPADYLRYPPPLTTYVEVVASPTLFRETLEKLHAAMATKFMIPTVGGQDLDLHRLFVEVTSRGGIHKVLHERRWREITGAFSFPSSATNASFILRKYYFSLLHHYEQIYFLRADGWSPAARDALQFASSKAIPQWCMEPGLSSSPITKAATQKETTQFLPEATPAVTTGSQVFGVIDGKFESGYLITVKIGSEEYKGVLYQSPLNPSDQVTEHQSNQQLQGTSVDSSAADVGGIKRKRRKKSEMRKRDPAHPKPNRSGYNFFFAEQHARLKPLYPGKDRDISRMIGESWNKLNETERAVYQEKALKDKERYRVEMERYRERLKTGQIITDALPIHQQPLHPLAYAAVDLDQKPKTKVATSSRSSENLIGINKNDESSIELSLGQPIVYEDAMQLHTLGPDLNLMMNLDKTLPTEGTPDNFGNDARNGDKRKSEDNPVNEKGGLAFMETQAKEEVFEVQKTADKGCSGDDAVQTDKKGTTQ